jgi:hypothetical protein
MELEEAIWMNKPVLGVVLGGMLGLFDGLSAWAYPEARAMMAAIVGGSVVKGGLTGLAAGLVARWQRSTLLGVAIGAIVGAALSMLAAAGQPDHYWAIVLPGMILGIVVGYATQRYGSPRSAGAPPGSALALAIVLATSGALQAQAPAPANDLASLSFFLGRWEGVAEGQPGKGNATREYVWELRSKIIYAKHRGVYPPQPANPKGEVHEDLGIYSYDRAATRVRFRQFHVEGFVIHYVQEPDTKPGTWIYTSEAIENIPKGYRGRETHVRLGPDEFEEIFELADPGKDFAVYTRTKFTRVR